jgi:LysR family hydrogen peroxide-inducible transcriptional activator
MGRTVKSITFRQLRYLQAVAEAESFTGAARLMKVSQPAISEQLRLLECRLGVSLFCREKKRILLTPAGRAVHQFAIDVEAQFDALLERTGAARRTERRGPAARRPPRRAGSEQALGKLRSAGGME